MCDYATAFAHLTLDDRYLRYPFYLRHPNVCERMKVKHLDVDEALCDRGFCSFVYSNGRAMAQRSRLLDVVSSYRPVASGGKFRNNVGGAVKSKLEFESRHKFSIACENSSFPGYATEKLVDAFAARTIPIYYGDPRVTEVFNRDAMIVVADYPDDEALLQRIRALDEDHEAYLRMLRTPALVDGDHVEKMNEALEAFLYHIIDQDYEKAFRRDRDFWGRLYLAKRRSEVASMSHPYRTAVWALRLQPEKTARELYSWARRCGGKLLRKLGLRK